MPPHHSLSLIHTTKTLTLISFSPTISMSQPPQSLLLRRPSPHLRPPTFPAPATISLYDLTSTRTPASNHLPTRTTVLEPLPLETTTPALALAGTTLFASLIVFPTSPVATTTTAFSSSQCHRNRACTCTLVALPSSFIPLPPPWQHHPRSRACLCRARNSPESRLEPLTTPDQCALAPVLAPHPLPRDINHGNHHLFRSVSPTQICNRIYTSISCEN